MRPKQVLRACGAQDDMSRGFFRERKEEGGCLCLFLLPSFTNATTHVILSEARASGRSEGPAWRNYHGRRGSLPHDDRDPELGAARPEPGPSGDVGRYRKRVYVDSAPGARGAGHPCAAETSLRSRRWSAHRSEE